LPPVRLLRIHHVGVAVESLSAASPVWEGLLGLVATKDETVASQRVAVRFYPVGESKIECLETLDPQGPVGKFLASRGPGLHHVAFEVDDCAAALAEAAAAGARLVDAVPRAGAAGSLVGFLHPKSTGGALVELVQPARR